MVSVRDSMMTFVCCLYIIVLILMNRMVEMRSRKCLYLSFDGVEVSLVDAEWLSDEQRSDLIRCCVVF